MRKALNDLARRMGNHLREGLGDILASEIKVVKINSSRYFALVDKNKGNIYTTILENGAILQGKYKVLEARTTPDWDWESDVGFFSRYQ